MFVPRIHNTIKRTSCGSVGVFTNNWKIITFPAYPLKTKSIVQQISSARERGETNPFKDAKTPREQKLSKIWEHSYKIHQYREANLPYTPRTEVPYRILKIFAGVVGVFIAYIIYYRVDSGEMFVMPTSAKAGLSRERVEHGIQLAEKALKAIPNPQSKEYIAHSKIVDLMRHGKVEEALQTATALLAQNPKYAYAYQLLAIPLYHMERYDEVSKVCQQGIKIDPTLPAFYYYQGEADFFGQRYIEAITAINLAIEANEKLPREQQIDDVEWRLRKLQCFLAVKDFPPALAVCNQVLKTHPDNIDANVQRGFLLLFSNSYEESYRAFMKALHNDPINMRAKDGRRIAYLGRKYNKYLPFVNVVDLFIKNYR